jgi:hypothetical protein
MMLRRRRDTLQGKEGYPPGNLSLKENYFDLLTIWVIDSLVQISYSSWSQHVALETVLKAYEPNIGDK